MMKKKKVFITGVAGFIGFHVACALTHLGHDVIGCDNFNDYYDPALKKARAAELAKKNVEVVQEDIDDLCALQRLVAKYQCTHIVHLAAQAGVRYSIQNPHIYIQSNVRGFLNILEVCRQFPQIPLVYASSSSVYGLNQKSPFSLNDSTDHQASLYGVTKKTNELMAHSYHHLYGLTLTGLRFFTVYGPWGRPDMAYYLFTKAIVESKPIQLFNYGQMKRDFTYIDDIVEGIIAALEIEKGNAIYNLGNHEPQELAYLVELIENELGIKAVKNYLPMQCGDVISTFADIAQSRQQLNFVPKTSLAEGIRHFVKWYKNYYHLGA